MRLEFSKEEKFEKRSYKNHIIKKYLQNTSEIYKYNLQVKIASKNCKQNLQVRFEFKTKANNEATINH